MGHERTGGDGEEGVLLRIGEGDGDGKGGIYVAKKDLWMVAGGALAALAALQVGRFTKALRPAAVSVVREGYAFKEWVAGKTEKLREDVEDIVAEGVHRYREDVASAAESVEREKAVLQKVGRMVEERLARVSQEREGA